MFYYYASIAYTFTNLVLALVVFFKARKSLVNQFYVFCVLGLVCFGFTSFFMKFPELEPLQVTFLNFTLFLYSLIPFFFLHFMVIFLRQFDILKSRKVIFLLYFAGLFSYFLVLKRLIPGPFSTEGLLSPDGYIYYITWMSIFFGIGIAILFSLLDGFIERGAKTNLLMTGFTLLMLVLPSPFTQSIYYTLFRRNVEWYGLTSAFSILIAIYLLFRHKVITTLYDAVKTALVVMNDVFIQTNDKFQIELFRGGVGVLGYTESQLFHHSLNDIIEQKYFIENYLSYVRNGKMKECLFDAEVICADGRKVIMDFSFSPIFEHDQIAGFIGIARDVTKRKTMEKALRVSEERFRRLSENAQDIIYRYCFQPIPRFEYISPAANDITQYTPDEFYANPDLFFDIVHPEDRSLLDNFSQGTENTSQTLTLRMFRKDGTLTWMELRNRPIHDENGTLLAIEGIGRDITEQKMLEEQLRQSQKLESIGTLAGGIAHDFNNILTIILGYSSVLLEHEMPREKLTQYVQTIQKAVQRGTTMVRELLTIARKSDAELSSTDVNAVIEELIELLQETFPRTLTISANLQSGETRVTADQNQLQQALLNVCVNARDAMPNGGKLTIGSKIVPWDAIADQFPNLERRSYLCITVRDTGTGMPDEVRQRIFEPFFTTKELGKGTGLGLAVVYSIVKSHNGHINVDSEVSEGTIISIYLPIEETPVKKIARPAPESAELRRGSETVLLVEDEDLLLELVCITLENSGFRVIKARNGEEAIRLYRQRRKEIDIVLTDLGMPKIGGWGLYQALKKINPVITVVFASGYFEPAIQSEMTRNGARFFLQKPYHPAEVLRTIREALDATAS